MGRVDVDCYLCSMCSICGFFFMCLKYILYCVKRNSEGGGVGGMHAKPGLSMVCWVNVGGGQILL